MYRVYVHGYGYGWMVSPIYAFVPGRGYVHVRVSVPIESPKSVGGPLVRATGFWGEGSDNFETGSNPGIDVDPPIDEGVWATIKSWWYDLMH